MAFYKIYTEIWSTLAPLSRIIFWGLTQTRRCGRLSALKMQGRFVHNVVLYTDRYL